MEDGPRALPPGLPYEPLLPVERASAGVRPVRREEVLVDGRAAPRPAREVANVPLLVAAGSAMEDLAARRPVHLALHLRNRQRQARDDEGERHPYSPPHPCEATLGARRPQGGTGY